MTSPERFPVGPIWKRFPRRAREKGFHVTTRARRGNLLRRRRDVETFPRRRPTVHRGNVLLSAPKRFPRWPDPQTFPRRCENPKGFHVAPAVKRFHVAVTRRRGNLFPRARRGNLSKKVSTSLRRSDGETFPAAATWKPFSACGALPRRGNLLTWKRFPDGRDVETFFDVETFSKGFHVHRRGNVCRTFPRRQDVPRA